MAEPFRSPPPAFDEALLSGYVDGVLTQQERQRVELEVARSPSARRTLDDLLALRAAARSTPFRVPDDRQWDERPRTRVSAWSRSLGWIIACAWLVGVAALAVIELLHRGGVGGTLVLGGLAGAALLFGSVLADRLRDLPTDRYRRVLK